MPDASAPVISFDATLEQIDAPGEKKGWTVLRVPKEEAARLQPGSRKAFRVAATIDGKPFAGLTLLPAGDGDYWLSVNAAMRRQTGRNAGATVSVQLRVDKEEYKLNADLVESLSQDEAASAYFYKLPPSHRNYYSKWIDEAKTEPTRAKRIAQSMNAFSRGMSYSEMMRAMK